MGQLDDLAMSAGKEFSDVIQESLDKEGRLADTFKEALEAKPAIEKIYKAAKEQNLDKRLVAAQILRGALNDVMSEDLSLDQAYEPGSQE